MEIKNAQLKDFDIAYVFIENLWVYNDYDREIIEKVYREVVEDENSFAFFLWDGDNALGFCHGAYFNTFWLSGKTCYLSSIITDSKQRGKGYAKILMDHAKELAIAKKCHGIVLDTGKQRVDAHAFYHKYGFQQDCHCFHLTL